MPSRYIGVWIGITIDGRSHVAVAIVFNNLPVVGAGAALAVLLVVVSGANVTNLATVVFQISVVQLDIVDGVVPLDAVVVRVGPNVETLLHEYVRAFVLIQTVGHGGSATPDGRDIVLPRRLAEECFRSDFCHVLACLGAEIDVLALSVRMLVESAAIISGHVLVCLLEVVDETVNL